MFRALFLFDQYKMTTQPDTRPLSSDIHLQLGRLHIAIHQIVFLRGCKNYTFCHLTDGQILLLSKTLKYYEQLLARHGFVRPNKSYLLNTNYVLEYTASEIIMCTHECVGISRRKRNRKSDFYTVLQTKIA
ncbi:two-component system LytT family response regulator [Runella defluvii]|uniref:Two-component system LytT family response regulator n=2 Tax=Runella defluvii TaxID=370973 RepID=A0A7W6ETQ7_9BACT|nr:two-component system LytT family response regulator [Runella defluvii]